MASKKTENGTEGGARTKPSAPRSPRVRTRKRVQVQLKSPLAATDMDFETVARLIIDPAPVWLVEAFRNWLPSLFLTTAVHAAQPSRSQMRRWLGEAISACELLTSLSRKDGLRGFLEATGEGPAIDHARFEQALGAFSLRAKAALESPSLSTPEEKARRGRGPALPVNVSSPQGRIAMLVVEAWRSVHGKAPGARNAHAAEAAERLWLLVRQSDRRWGNGLAASWRRHFEAVSAPKLDDERTWLFHYFMQARHSAALLTEEPDPSPGT